MPDRNILIVDDEEKIRKFLELELKAAGYNVRKAENATQAIEYAKEELPDLIVMDVMLPDLNGAEVVKILKKDKQLSSIPIIFLTAMLTKAEESRNPIGINVDEHWFYALAKPYDHNKLLEIIEKCIGK